MKAWARATRDMVCGFCGKDEAPTPIGRGDPILVIRVSTVDRDLIRCAKCAGEAVPADLTYLPMQTGANAATPNTFLPIGSVASEFRRTDWKAAAAADESADHDDCED